MKRKIKKALKEDEFTNVVTKVITLLQDHKREFMAALSVVVFVVVVILGMNFIKTKNEKKESQILGQILKLEAGLKDNPDNLTAIEQLGNSSKFGRVAFIKVATHMFELGEIDKAFETLSKINDKKKDFIYYQAQDLKAQLLMKQKNYEEALNIYQTLEEENPEDYAMDVILFQKAQILQEKNDIEQAILIYKRIQEDFPSTITANEASQEIIKLEEKK